LRPPVHLSALVTVPSQLFHEKVCKLAPATDNSHIVVPIELSSAQTATYHELARAMRLQSMPKPDSTLFKL
jgi:hypothetical protein